MSVEPKHEYVNRTSELHRRQSLEITVVKACPHCQAPAFYNSHDSIRDGWPGAWVPPKDPREGQFVGEVCPNCERPRDVKPVPHGEVWSNEWRSWPAKARSFKLWTRRFRDLFRRASR